VGPLRQLHIRAGDHLQFSGTVIGNGPAYPARIGVSSDADATLLTHQGAPRGQHREDHGGTRLVT
jgi:hypothetical protein